MAHVYAFNPSKAINPGSTLNSKPHEVPPHEPDLVADGRAGGAATLQRLEGPLVERRGCDCQGGHSRQGPLLPVQSRLAGARI